MEAIPTIDPIVETQTASIGILRCNVQLIHSRRVDRVMFLTAKAKQGFTPSSS